ncbi:hypothetical protein HUO09_12110 [Vibrio sp. Y2-5]|uniref:hypothetical protein n=1 Tax=Vibrio TaxID=662 RepID=UPI00142D2042|nr:MULTISPECIES: hypothetical protein [Vibrio]MBD0787089.1 hypothetical protein [Vibrio sp. Y2-5]NIY91403.1 hypothetical protein [Vibrio diazotrophicus]
MNPVGAGSVSNLNAPQAVKNQASANTESASPAPLKVEQNKVTLSDEGKALLAALQDIDQNGKMPEGDKTMSDKVEAFTYGALGMEHPDKVKEKDDSFFSAGQYLSAAATVGSLLLLLA